MEKYIELLKCMMACKSVTADIEAVNRASAVLQKFLEAEGLKCVIEDCDGRKVIYVSNCEGKADLLLNSHIDVVPPINGDADHNLVIDGDILRGRGTEDCLGNMLACVKCMIDTKGRAKVGATFVCDEETGGKTTAAMVARGYGANKMAIVMDGGAYSIVTAQKGIIVIKLVARGRGGHSSRPWDLDNPIDKLIDGYCRLKAAWPAVTKDNIWKDSMTPCIVNSGFAVNQIPDVAEMTINIRYIDVNGGEAIIEKVKKITGLDVELNRGCKPLYTDENNPLMQKLMEQLRAKFPGKKCAFSKMCGATDARHLGPLNIPVAIMGIEGGGAHSANEWASLKSIKEYGELLADFALGL